jgi:predicted NAD/FAD-binding protein
LRNILRFNSIARKTRLETLATSVPLDAFLDEAGLSTAFRELYLYPMAAAIWSCPWGEIGRFPAVTFLRFFANHGLIQLQDRPQWRTVEGGSSRYMDRLIADLGQRAHKGVGVRSVTRTGAGVDLVLADGRLEHFDDVVLACHSDQTLRLLDQPTPTERRVLGAIPYQENRVLLHRDAAMMPTRRRVWSSWNYLAEPSDDPARAVSVTYWMNSLQRLSTRNDYFVSLNPWREPAAGSVVAEYAYHHPVFSLDALTAQRQLHRIQGVDGLWFAGAWTGYGFHEDGMRSGVEVARALGAEVPWEAEIDVSRDLTLVPDIVKKAA